MPVKLISAVPACMCLHSTDNCVGVRLSCQVIDVREWMRGSARDIAIYTPYLSHVVAWIYLLKYMANYGVSFLFQPNSVVYKLSELDFAPCCCSFDVRSAKVNSCSGTTSRLTADSKIYRTCSCVCVCTDIRARSNKNKHNPYTCIICMRENLSVEHDR